MDPTPYKINKILREIKRGSTKPFACAISGVLKYDCDESPFAVYNELTAVRLAQTLHIPIADGLLTDHEKTDMFASLEVGLTNQRLPILRDYQYEKVAELYPTEVAALTAFDIWIGNRDRRGNLLATIEGAYRIFGGIDHGIALLSVEETPGKSITRLSSDELIVNHHPFYGLVKKQLLLSWADRLALTESRDIEECCRFNRPLKGLQEQTQQELANALNVRKLQLPAIVATHIVEPIDAI